MWSETETFVAEFAEGTEASSSSAHEKCGNDDMEIDLEPAEREWQAALESLRAKRDPVHIRKAIRAYRRDLPKLIAGHKERHVVAYDGNKQLDIAPTRDELIAKLEDQGIKDRTNLFIKVINDSKKGSKERQGAYTSR